MTTTATAALCAAPLVVFASALIASRIWRRGDGLNDQGEIDAAKRRALEAANDPSRK